MSAMPGCIAVINRSVAQRHAADRKAIKAARSSSVVAREEQINFKVPKGTKARFKMLAMSADLSMVAAFERAMELLEAEIGKGRKS
jgi:hypothetical protein